MAETRTLTLSEFLLARIAEDEERARRSASTLLIANLDRVAVVGSDEHLTFLHHERWEPRRVLAECEAKRKIIALRSAPRDLGNWRPDVGGDYCLGGGDVPWFANYWPDDTVSASLYDRVGEDAERTRESGILKGLSRGDCMAKAEAWIRANVDDVDPVIRLLALPYADHPNYDEAWQP